jgi:hypothetical protein
MVTALVSAFVLIGCGPASYTVFYSGNGSNIGSAPIDPTLYLPGDTVTVLGNTGDLIKFGDTFTGWCSLPDGTGLCFSPGQTFAMGDGDVALYAAWNADLTYTVSYDGNANTGGAAPVDPLRYAPGQTVTVLGNTGQLVKAGFVFSGWNPLPDPAPTTYQPGQSFTMGSANVTLYALWSPATYTVTYEGNGNTGGLVPVDGTRYLTGQQVLVSGLGHLVRTGFAFSGWNTKADGTGTTYKPWSGFLMGTANVTLFAKWEAAQTYTVTYEGNGNSGGHVPIDGTRYETGETVVVLGNLGNLAKSGFAFTGWNTLVDGNGTTYLPWQEFAMGGANVTLFAMWSAQDL